MTKVMLATRSRTLAPLFDPGFRDAVKRAGAQRLQLNVDDAPVAPALRFGPGAPVTALLSLWTDGSPTPLVELVGEVVRDHALNAYRVTEHVRLDPAPTDDGVRSDVLAQVAILRRPATMSRRDYLDYWLREHTPIAIRTQNTSAYIQNVVEEPLTATTEPAAAIVEEHFPMAAMTDPHAFYGSGGDPGELDRRITELMASVARFGADQGLDLVPTSRHLWRL